MSFLRPDIPLDPQSFRTISELAYRESGIRLVEGKASMVQSRLRHRLRALGLKEFASYCRLVQSDDGEEERRHLISALTTNVSHFFREDHHFDHLRLMIRARRDAVVAGDSFRVWSAGCSYGQEAISAAMTILDEIPEAEGLDVRILATDIDAKVVKFARRGQFPRHLMDGVADPLRARFFFETASKCGSGLYQASDKIMRLIQFNELNLLGNWPMVREFDIIFCRNVVIYFDAQTQSRLWPRFRASLADDGALFLGHSERIPSPELYRFAPDGPTTYRAIHSMGAAKRLTDRQLRRSRYGTS